MKRLVLILLLAVSCLSVRSQDMVGNKLSDVKAMIRHLNGLKIQAKGDSLLLVYNKKLKRDFKFKFNSTTHICYEEDIRLNFSALKNITIMNQMARSGSSSAVDLNDAESIYETADKMIYVRPAGDLVDIIFCLKKTNPDLASSSGNEGSAIMNAAATHDSPADIR